MNAMLRYGLIGGVVLCVPMFGPMLLFGLQPEWMRLGEIIGYTSMVLCMSATWFAMRHEQQRRGALGFSRLFGVGVGVSAVAGLLFGLVTMLFYALAGDALPEALIEYYQAQARAPGVSPEDSARQLAEIESMRPFFFNEALQGAVMFATVFVIGVVVSVVAALQLRFWPGETG